eukprot:GHVU01210581.1.p1 GENE.GHVU01210581.1~~GHVU01210581.1.p1  ORF type:complete len:125 (+),score=5.59 GHVU01210581.1:492-866(+)
MEAEKTNQLADTFLHSLVYVLAHCRWLKNKNWLTNRLCRSLRLGGMARGCNWGCCATGYALPFAFEFKRPPANLRSCSSRSLLHCQVVPAKTAAIPTSVGSCGTFSALPAAVRTPAGKVLYVDG